MQPPSLCSADTPPTEMCKPRHLERKNKQDKRKLHDENKGRGLKVTVAETEIKLHVP